MSASALGLAPGKPRALEFAQGGARTDLRLLQVDDALLKEIVSDGVVIKGTPDDEAVLVTKSRTFAMKVVETTNLCLLVAPSAPGDDPADTGSQPDQAGVRAPNTGVGAGLMTQWGSFKAASGGRAPVVVSATSDSHIELVEIAPRLAPLRRLLWARPYGLQDEGAEQGAAGEAMEAEGAGAGGEGGYTFEELLELVQASPAELRAALEAEGALEVAGRWRAVERSYLGALLQSLLLTAEQQGMPLSRLDESALAQGLEEDGYHPAVVRHCLKTYGSPVVQQQDTAAGDAAMAEAQAQASEGGLWALDPAKVCVYFAHQVLAGRALPLPAFHAAWARAVPYGLEPSMDMLKAEALVDGAGAEARISSFPASSLPTDPAERFAALFRRRPRWEWTALEPYLASIRVPGQSAEALLMRFARASQATPDSPLEYSAR
ncbi:hypothetical protein HYH03_011518 [Edaphochlamys debaryana]|uniref:Sister chromatid cohesion protein DCC1 n=1 Tax=Edaphochlamys debaryana TaxID=47281 RepID=A0A835XTN1_9CHLO|nr:hypothetical protein HYH03_011518 [Edaphochlamys debaryana]|eukprot:KAG2490053.1 hypothetical protein HYH03_011518 [Edaphochlamys debaryana]